MTNITQIEIQPHQVIQIVHPRTGTVVNVAIDLASESVYISHDSNDDGLGMDWTGRARSFINNLVQRYAVSRSLDNSHLQAATPALLEVAETFIDLYDDYDDSEWNDRFRALAERCRCAIAQAQGGAK